MAEIISRSFLHIQTSKLQDTLHKIGGHELFNPDYQLVCAWAEELHLTAEEVLDRILMSKPDTRDPDASTWWDSTTLENGRFKVLYVNRYDIPISSFPLIAGLSIEKLKIEESYLIVIEMACTPHGQKPLQKNSNYPRFSKLNLSLVPSLRVLDCSCLNLAKLNIGLTSNLNYLDCSSNNLGDLQLGQTPNLYVLDCSLNNLSELDLRFAPNLKNLMCAKNNLKNLNLEYVPNLQIIDFSFNKISDVDLRSNSDLIGLFCAENQLTDLNLNSVPNLKIIDCSRNNLKNMTLVSVPEITHINCSENDIHEINICPLNRLIELIHSSKLLRIIQRPDQKFT